MNPKSRLDKFEKRRKNKKRISMLFFIAGILVVVLACIWLFGGGSNEASNQPVENNNIKITDDDSDSDHESDDTAQAEENDSEKDNDEKDHDKNINKEKVETDDSNVIEAYTVDWEPSGTDQSGPHTTDYDEGSDDRKEIKHAAAKATGLDENDLTTFWVGNAGNQKVTTTIFNSEKSKVFRVALTWADSKGWQVTKVEKLKKPAR